MSNFNDVIDQLDWAFDQMERAVNRFKEAGYDILASSFSSRWVNIHDQFHAQRAAGGSGQLALNTLRRLEDEMVDSIRIHLNVN